MLGRSRGLLRVIVGTTWLICDHILVLVVLPREIVAAVGMARILPIRHAAAGAGLLTKGGLIVVYKTLKVSWLKKCDRVATLASGQYIRQRWILN